jgi:hypothetical protein
MNAPGKSGLMAITCVLYRKAGIALLQALHDRGIHSASLHHARGSAIGDETDERGRIREFEKEVVTILVDESISDDIFGFVFEQARIDRSHGGFLYMERVSRGSSMDLPVST